MNHRPLNRPLTYPDDYDHGVHAAYDVPSPYGYADRASHAQGQIDLQHQREQEERERERREREAAEEATRLEALRPKFFHLHFEVRPGGGDPIDPLTWLREHGLEPT